MESKVSDTDSSSVTKGQTLSEAVSQKEAELESFKHAAVQQLEVQVEELKRQKLALENKLKRLREDFKYNLDLLDGRDTELANYELQFESCHAQLEQNSAEREQLRNIIHTLLEKEKQHVEEQESLKGQCQEVIENLHMILQRSQAEAAQEIEGLHLAFQEEKLELMDQIDMSKAAHEQILAEIKHFQELLEANKAELKSSMRHCSELEAKTGASEKHFQSKAASMHKEIDFLRQRVATVESNHARDLEAAKAATQSLQQASEDERLEYERLLQAACSHRSSDESLMHQRLSAATAQTEELERRLHDSHAQAQLMQEVLEDRMQGQAHAFAQQETQLRAEKSAAQTAARQQESQHRKEKKELKVELLRLQNELESKQYADEDAKRMQLDYKAKYETVLEDEAKLKAELASIRERLESSEQRESGLQQERERLQLQANGNLDSRLPTATAHQSQSSTLQEKLTAANSRLQIQEGIIAAMTAEMEEIAGRTSRQGRTQVSKTNATSVDQKELSESSLQDKSKLNVVQHDLEEEQAYSAALKVENERLIEISGEMHRELRDLKEHASATLPRPLPPFLNPNQAYHSWTPAAQNREPKGVPQYVLRMPANHMYGIPGSARHVHDQAPREPDIPHQRIEASDQHSVDSIVKRLENMERLASMSQNAQLETSAAESDGDWPSPRSPKFEQKLQASSLAMPLSASARATPSQRSKLKGLQRQSGAKKEGHRVRNWNIPDPP